MARIGFVLWCPLAAVLAFVPIVWSVLCARCRTRLAMGDTSGAVMACRLCRWAAGGGILLVAGLVFGVWNAWRTGHPKELPIWAIAFLVLAGVGAGNAYTYVVMRRIVRDVKAGNPARPAA